MFNSITPAPLDAIFGVVQAYNSDPHPDKVNLSIGAYRDADGLPLVFE